MASADSGDSKSKYEKFEALLYQENVFTAQLAKIEEKTKLKRTYLVLIATVILAIYLLFGYAAGLLCSLIGFFYPAYKSIKAIESPEKDDDTKWLTYWVVYSIFHLVEFFADIFVFWIPFYWLLKCGFLVWCMFPWNNGSVLLYKRFIRPFILKYKDDIDDAASRATDALKDAVKEGKDAAVDAAVDHVVRDKQE